MQSIQSRWASKSAFIFAAASAAIGLGNIWRFPYLTGQHGGGAFVLTYLAFVALLGVPLVLSEMVLGRIGRNNPSVAVANVAEASGRSRRWGMFGGMGILCAFLVLSFYVVIIGWVLDYFIRAVSGQFSQLSAEVLNQHFIALQANGWRMLISDTAVIVATALVVVLGVKRGLERAVLWMFPALLILMLVLLVHAMTLSGFHEAVHFLFSPDFSKLSGHAILIALGQAFFSLSIAMAITMMFSAYLPDKTPLVRSALIVSIADTGFALLAGLIIFPVVFSFHLNVEAGPSLIFQSLPLAFGQMPYGTLLASLFFLLLFFAAFTSSIGLIEPAVVWVMERLKKTRAVAVLMVSVACWVLSLGSIASFAKWPIAELYGHSIYSLIDGLTSQIMMPVGGLLTAIFLGWFVKPALFQEQLAWRVGHAGFIVWRFLLRYVAPVAILLVLLTSLGVI